MTAILELAGVNAGYGLVRALHAVDLRVEPGEVVALIGRNGAGKSTTLKVALGLLPATDGTVRFKGAPVNAKRPDLQVRAGMGVVPEGRRVFTGLDVEENLRMGALRTPRSVVDERLERVQTLFPRLRERRTQVAGTLSGGEQQMLALGRALMGEPELLLMDEPSLGLAPVIVSEIFDNIATIARSGVSILLVEQNARLALRLAQRAYVLEAGNVVASGTADEIKSSPDLQRAYLGGRSQQLSLSGEVGSDGSEEPAQ